MYWCDADVPEIGSDRAMLLECCAAIVSPFIIFPFSGKILFSIGPLPMLSAIFLTEANCIYLAILGIDYCTLVLFLATLYQIDYYSYEYIIHMSIHCADSRLP